MRAYGRGDARAFEALYARHRAATYRYFLRHAGGNAATADELHQDLWLKVIGARERYAGAGEVLDLALHARASSNGRSLARLAMASRWRRSRTRLRSRRRRSPWQHRATAATTRCMPRSMRRLAAPVRCAGRRSAAAAGCIPAARRGWPVARGDRQPHGCVRRDGKEPVALCVSPFARGAGGHAMSNHERESSRSPEQGRGAGSRLATGCRMNSRRQRSMRRSSRLRASRSRVATSRRRSSVPAPRTGVG